MVVHPR
ncbi:hypothetical protein ACMD2_25325, partial [Ananas comosus]